MKKSPSAGSSNSVPLGSLAASLKRCGRWGSTRGLMFTRAADRALLFTFRRPTRVALHMFFVFYPIDVLFLDGEGLIVDVRRGLRPFRCCRSRVPALYVVELPQGRAEGLAEGMRLTGVEAS